MILSLTSESVTKPRMYDVADSVLAQKLSQVPGIGQVFVGGGAKPAVRAEVNPTLLSKLGVGVEQVRAALGAANANRPKGEIANAVNAWQITANDQLFKADDYKNIIIARNPSGGVVRLQDVADVQDSVEDIRNTGVANGKPAVLMIVFRQPGANIIEAVDRVKALVPELQASIPAAIKLEVALDRTTTIRASVADIQITLVISIVLVVFVVFIFLRNLRATFIPSVAVPLSLIGTFGVMYLLDYSVDNLSLMALAISTGFVVDDAIVVLEDITRYLEQGMGPVQAAFRGAREIGFTVLSMSTSLVAVFIPILLMQGLVGRLFREFAVVLSTAIVMSLLVSLTVTPMLCAKFLRPQQERKHGRIYRASESVFDGMLKLYRGSLGWVLRHQALTLAVTIAHGLPQHLSLRHCAEGLLPPAGHRTARRIDSGGAGHLLPRHTRQDAAVCAHRADRSGGQQCRWLCRRRPIQHRTHVRGAEAAQRAQRHGRPGHQPAAGQACRGSGSNAVSHRHAGPEHWRAVCQRAVPVHHPVRRPAGPQLLGAANPGQTAVTAGAARREL